MNTPALVYDRLRNHKLTSSTFKQPADVVRWLGAVQAQDFNAAKWALALRMRSATNDIVEDAINRGEILRTHVLRPTWHFVVRDLTRREKLAIAGAAEHYATFLGVPPGNATVRP